MKKISILAIITLVLFAAEFATTIIYFWDTTSSSFLIENSMVELQKPTTGAYRRTAVELNVYPINVEMTPGEAHNNLSEGNTPFLPKTLVVGFWSPLWAQMVFGICILLCIPIIIWGIICFIRLLVSVLKGQVFTRKNVRRLRIFVYGVYGSIFIIQIYQWLCYRYASKQVAFQDFAIGSFETTVGWSDFFLMALIVEIFAIGVKLQEEQELTI